MRVLPSRVMTDHCRARVYAARSPSPRGALADKHCGGEMQRAEDRQALPPTAWRAVAIGAATIGALAIGFLAIGRLRIGRLAVKSGEFGQLDVDELNVGRLTVKELITEGDDRPE